MEPGLFIGFGSTRAGNEAAAGKSFEGAVAYCAALEAAGEIESVEDVLLNAHGGDLRRLTDGSATRRPRRPAQLPTARFRSLRRMGRAPGVRGCLPP